MKNRIGIIGGGQLGRMMAYETRKMGYILNVLDPTSNSPAGQVADNQIVADYYDHNAIKKLAEISDFITTEIEFSDGKILDEITEKYHVQVNPSSKTLSIINDKLAQKIFFKKNNIPVADFIEINNNQDIVDSSKKYGYPMILKSRFDAYDGRGNYLIKKVTDIEKGLNKLENKKLYIEKYVPFIKELSVVVARSVKGEIVTYPVFETIHKNNICHIVIAPARIEPLAKKRAEKLAKKVMQHLEGAGVFCIEMFLMKDNKVLVNEIAPRVHNAGHLTIEACLTNQFAQHIRAISGLSLGRTDMIVPAAVMINILGERTGQAEVSGVDKALAIPGVFVHIYGKAQTKPERKMGHITVIDKDIKTAYKKALKARKFISI